MKKTVQHFNVVYYYNNSLRKNIKPFVANKQKINGYYLGPFPRMCYKEELDVLLKIVSHFHKVLFNNVLKRETRCTFVRVLLIKNRN